MAIDLEKMLETMNILADTKVEVNMWRDACMRSEIRGPHMRKVLQAKMDDRIASIVEENLEFLSEQVDVFHSIAEIATVYMLENTMLALVQDKKLAAIPVVIDSPYTTYKSQEGKVLGAHAASLGMAKVMLHYANDPELAALGAVDNDIKGKTPEEVMEIWTKNNAGKVWTPDEIRPIVERRFKEIDQDPYYTPVRQRESADNTNRSEMQVQFDEIVEEASKWEHVHGSSLPRDVVTPLIKERMDHKLVAFIQQHADDLMDGPFKRFTRYEKVKNAIDLMEKYQLSESMLELTKHEELCLAALEHGLARRAAELGMGDVMLAIASNPKNIEEHPDNLGYMLRHDPAKFGKQGVEALSKCFEDSEFVLYNEKEICLHAKSFGNTDVTKKVLDMYPDLVDQKFNERTHRRFVKEHGIDDSMQDPSATIEELAAERDKELAHKRAENSPEATEKRMMRIVEQNFKEIQEEKGEDFMLSKEYALSALLEPKGPQKAPQKG